MYSYYWYVEQHYMRVYVCYSSIMKSGLIGLGLNIKNVQITSDAV